MGNIKHVSMNIEWFEKVLKSLSSNQIRDEKCKAMFWYTYRETLEVLNQMKKAWRLFIPADWCENVREDGSCWC